MPATSNSARDRTRLERILYYCSQAQETLDAVSRDRSFFLSSHIHCNAVAMCILQIGELTKQLSDEFVSTHTDIPWHLIARTRDLYAHHYGTADFEMVWETAVQDLPLLATFCKNILQQ